MFGSLHSIFRCNQTGVECGSQSIPWHEKQIIRAVNLFGGRDPCDRAERLVSVICTAPSPTQHLFALDLEGPEVNGDLTNLPLFSFPNLTSLIVSGTSLTGSLPAELNGPQLDIVRFRNNTLLGGPLPEAWGTLLPNGSPRFPLLRQLQLTESQWSGKLPLSWGSSDVFQMLQVLEVRGTPLSDGSSLGITGPIPDDWVTSTSFISLTVLPPRPLQPC